MGQTNWVPFGQPAFTPGFEFYNFCVGQNTDGRLEVFLLGNNGILGHSWQLAPGKDWSEWASLGQPPNNTSPAFPRVKRNADGRLEVFVLGSDYRPWHIWQLAPGKNNWSPWSSLGQPAGVNVGSSVLVSNVDGRLEVFDVGSDGALWHTWQLSPNRTWRALEQLSLARPSAYRLLHPGKKHFPRSEHSERSIFHVNRRKQGSRPPWL